MPCARRWRGRRRGGRGRAAHAKARARLASLSTREREVLERVVAGRLNKQIAAELGAAEKTIKVHRARVMDKMAAASLAELVRLAELAGVLLHRIDAASSPPDRSLVRWEHAWQAFIVRRMNRASTFRWHFVAIAATPAFAADSAWVAPLHHPARRVQRRRPYLGAPRQRPRGGIGTILDFESDLNVTKNKTLPDLEFLWRINPRHGIEGFLVRAPQSLGHAHHRRPDQLGRHHLSGPHRGEHMTFDSDVWRVAYRYSPIDDGGNELAFLLGAHYTTLKTSPWGPDRNSRAVGVGGLPAAHHRRARRLAPSPTAGASRPSRSS